MIMFHILVLVCVQVRVCMHQGALSCPLTVLDVYTLVSAFSYVCTIHNNNYFSIIHTYLNYCHYYIYYV